MGKTFFSVMQQVQKDINRGVISNDSVTLFNRLKETVETCDFTSSKATKFVCKNWNSSSKDLVDKWYGLTGGTKSKHTFRSQISTASTLLFSIFGNIQPSVFGDLAELSEEDLAIRHHLVDTLNSFVIEDVFAYNLFISEVLNYFEDSEPTARYTMEECTNELKILKLLAKTNIYKLLDTCDSDKLKYLLSVLIQPLTSIKNRSVNTDKLAVLRELGAIQTSYSLLQDVAKSSDKDIEEPTKTVKLPIKEDHRFKLGITNEMAKVLEKRLEQPTTEAEMKFEASLGDKRDRYVQTLVGTLYAMTPEGFESYIRRQNSILLAEAINGDYQGFKGVDVDTTEFSKDLKSFIKYEKTE